VAHVALKTHGFRFSKQSIDAAGAARFLLELGVRHGRKKLGNRWGERIGCAMELA